MDSYDYRDDYFKTKINVAEIIGEPGDFWFNRPLITIEDIINLSELCDSAILDKPFGSKEAVEAGIQSIFPADWTISYNGDFSNDRELSWIDRFKRWLESPSPF